jgi:hypothetical protein
MSLNPAQIHLLLNHVPVLGSIGVLLILLAGMAWRREEFVRLALGLALLVALLTIPVYRTGEPAEKRIEHMPGVTEHWIEQHEDMAKVAFAGILLLGALSAFALGASRGRRLAGWVTPAALALTLVVCVLMGITAHRGGLIRHTELRPGVAAPASGGEGEMNEKSEAGEHEGH